MTGIGLRWIGEALANEALGKVMDALGLPGLLALGGGLLVTVVIEGVRRRRR